MFSLLSSTSIIVPCTKFGEATPWTLAHSEALAARLCASRGHRAVRQWPAWIRRTPSGALSRTAFRPGVEPFATGMRNRRRVILNASDRTMPFPNDLIDFRVGGKKRRPSKNRIV